MQLASAGLKPLPVTETIVPDGPTFGFNVIWAEGDPTVKDAIAESPPLPVTCTTYVPMIGVGLTTENDAATVPGPETAHK